MLNSESNKLDRRKEIMEGVPCLGVESAPDVSDSDETIDNASQVAVEDSEATVEQTPEALSNSDSTATRSRSRPLKRRKIQRALPLKWQLERAGHRLARNTIRTVPREIIALISRARDSESCIEASVLLERTDSSNWSPQALHLVTRHLLVHPSHTFTSAFIRDTLLYHIRRAVFAALEERGTQSDPESIRINPILFSTLIECANTRPDSFFFGYIFGLVREGCSRHDAEVAAAVIRRATLPMVRVKHRLSKEGLEDDDETEDELGDVPTGATLNNWDICLEMLCEMGVAAETGQEFMSVRKFPCPDPKGCVRAILEAVLERMKESNVEMPAGAVMGVLEYLLCWESTWPVPGVFQWCLGTFIDIYKREYDGKPDEKVLDGLQSLRCTINESVAHEYSGEWQREMKLKRRPRRG
ncbi:hypothetical protein B0H67DRAFT_297970 [Lasiosphaeris hirsuta]|uniref:Uncharacterized protein n=1 Tax=Lasiosphaeris hirsuta TaxID=260670 RepID=A0AA40A9F0_9PEZI|nr:hypothetical protein B0H67DRAFT_297970 [Lasiosphaeris hirsuta]